MNRPTNTATKVHTEQEKKENYKRTIYGNIPKEWFTLTIGETFDFLRTTSYSRNQLNYDADNELYYIHYGDIHATYKTPMLNFEKQPFIPRLNKDVVISETSQFLKDGDVIIADASEDYEGVGAAIELQNINNRKVISGLHTFALRDKEGLTIEGFRTYIFKNSKVKKALKTIATGSKVYGISKSNIQKFKIVLPTIEEQQKIAKILSTWDKAIALQEKLIAKKQALKKGLMQQLLTGKKRFPGFSGEWEEVRLGDVGKIVTGSTPKTKEEDNYNGNYLFVSPTDMGKEKYIKSTVKTLTMKGFNSGRKIPKNSVLFVCIGSTIGKVGISNSELITNQQINAIIPKNIYEEGFIYYQLLREGSRIKLIAGEQAVPMINKSDFSTIKILVTEIEEQKRIADTLSSVDVEINVLKDSLKYHKKQKQGLMQQLLTGEKRV